MNKKIFSLLVIILLGVAVVCVIKKLNGPETQKKVDYATTVEALNLTNSIIKAAKNKQGREFAGLSEKQKNYSGLYECFLLINNVAPAEKDIKWDVRKDSNSGVINVSCKLANGRTLLIVLRRQTDQSLKFAFATTMV